MTRIWILSGIVAGAAMSFVLALAVLDRHQASSAMHDPSLIRASYCQDDPSAQAAITPLREPTTSQRLGLTARLAAT